ncbi:MAG: hypothetical protein AB7F38_09945 [Piscinibacter sp.]
MHSPMTSPKPAALAPHVGPRAWILLALAALLAAALWIHGPIPQWDSYHHFADRRAWLAIPNAADVLSNLPFAVIGAWWLWAMRGLPRTPATPAWRAFAVALIATAAGSAFYHWAPDNASLAFDRLPIAWACAALTCAFLAERVDERWSRSGVLAGALVLASASVALWWWSEAAGRSDLRAYLLVQFLPMLLVPAALLLSLPRRFAAAAPDRAWWGVLLGYALAKALEVADHAVFEHLAWLSGHTLKHLAAAGAALWLVHGAWRAARANQLR